MKLVFTFFAGVIGFFVVLGIIITIGVHITEYTEKSKSITKKPEVVWTETDASDYAYLMAEDFVKDKLKAPATAQFPKKGTIGSFVRQIDGQNYFVVSFVDSQNSFGANIRTKFSCEIVQIKKGSWQLVSLNME